MADQPESSSVWKHPWLVGALAVLGALATIVTIWFGFTRDTIPEFLAKRGVTVSEFYIVILLLALCIVEMSRLAIMGWRTYLATPKPQRIPKALVDHSDVNHAARSALAAEAQQARNERDGMEQAWMTCKREFALARLRWFAQRIKTNMEKAGAVSGGGAVAGVRVTIRFVGYQKEDHAIVKQLEDIIHGNTDWRLDPPDGGNNPALLPSDNFKVVFVSNLAANFSEVHSLFQDGLLVKGLRHDQIAWRNDNDRIEPTHLVIEVLPTVTA